MEHAKYPDNPASCVFAFCFVHFVVRGPASRPRMMPNANHAAPNMKLLSYNPSNEPASARDPAAQVNIDAAWIQTTSGNNLYADTKEM